VVTHQLQVERRTAKARRPKTDVLPLNHATKQAKDALLHHLKSSVLLHYPANAKHENCIFHSLYQRTARIQPVAAWFLQYFWLTTRIHDSLNLLIKAFSSGLLGGMVQEKASWERCSSWTVLHAQNTRVLSYGFPLSQGNTEALDRW